MLSVKGTLTAIGWYCDDDCDEDCDGTCAGCGEWEDFWDLLLECV